MSLNDTLDQMDVSHIFRTNHPKAAEYAFFLSAHGTFSRLDHMLGHKTSLSKFQETESISRIFSNENGIKLKISYKKKTRKHTNTWRLNYILLNMNGSTMTSQKKAKDTLRQMKMKTEQHKI